MPLLVPLLPERSARGMHLAPIDLILFTQEVLYCG